jgi:copper resistance protein C
MSRLTPRAPSATFAAVVLGLSWLMLGTVAAYAHAHLTRSEPRDGSTVVPAPHEVSLWFTEGLEKVFTTVEVHDAQGARVDQGDPQISGDTMRVELKPLPPGTYKVIWRALSVDTHKTDGTFSFQVGQ